jgi:hypothetical protein
MRQAAKFASLCGLIASIVGPVIALVVYPKGNWLFATPLLGVLVIVLNNRFAKQPSPEEIADHAERLLNGTFGGWDVDDYEHLGVKDPRLKELHMKTMRVGGLPEEWVSLPEPQKNDLRKIILELRAVKTASKSLDQ